MSNYWRDMMVPEELARLPYISTLPEFVTWIEQQYSDLPALSDQVSTYTYKQMCDRVAHRRAFLEELGLPKGSNIAVFDRTSVDAIEWFLAITSAGYTALMLPSSLPAPAVAGCCARFEIKALFVRDEFKALAEGAPTKVYPAASTSEKIAPVATVDKEDPAAIFFTGGTTGAPKGVVLPHRSVMRGSHNGSFYKGSIIGRHTYIEFMPLSHVFGLIRSTLSVFQTGNLLYTAEDMKATIAKIPVLKPTILVLVPGLCEILLGLVKMYGPGFLGSVESIISGAAPVPPRMIVQFKKLGINLFFGYGMTEGAFGTAGNIDIDNRPTSVGPAFPNHEVKIVDGELWMRGDHLMHGYYKDPEATKAVMTEDGWLKTGDLAHLDDDGFIYITGRIKNLIILSNGENVSPEELEDALDKDLRVRDCLVKEDEMNGEKVIAVEILPVMQAFEGVEWTEIEKTMREVVDKLNATLPTTHRIMKVTVRKEDFKRTGSFKVSRNQ